MIVVKVGGSEGIDLDAVCTDVAELVRAGTQLVLVHGGSYRTNEVATALGHPPEFVTSISGYTSRRTDRETLRIFEMVYCGEVNKGIVERLQSLGVNAVGLSGIDGRLLEGRRKDALKVMQRGRRMVIRDDYTGRALESAARERLSAGDLTSGHQHRRGRDQCRRRPCCGAYCRGPRG